VNNPVVDYGSVSDFQLQASESKVLALIDRIEISIDARHAEIRSAAHDRRRPLDTTVLLPLYDAAERARRELEAIRFERRRRAAE
jgi:hypothetical protein